MTTQNYYRPINIELASPKYSDHMRQKSTLGQLLQKTSRARPACVIPSPRISKLRKGNPGSLGDRSLALAVPPKTLYVSSLRHNSMIYENQMSQNHIRRNRSDLGRPEKAFLGRGWASLPPDRSGPRGKPLSWGPRLTWSPRSITTPRPITISRLRLRKKPTRMSKLKRPEFPFRIIKFAIFKVSNPRCLEAPKTNMQLFQICRKK